MELNVPYLSDNIHQTVHLLTTCNIHYIRDTIKQIKHMPTNVHNLPDKIWQTRHNAFDIQRTMHRDIFL